MELTEEQFNKEYNLFKDSGFNKEVVVGKDYEELVTLIYSFLNRLGNLQNNKQVEQKLQDIQNNIGKKNFLFKIKSDLCKIENSIKPILQREKALKKLGEYIGELFKTKYEEQFDQYRNDEFSNLEHIKNFKNPIITHVNNTKRRVIVFFCECDYHFSDVVVGLIRTCALFVGWAFLYSRNIVKSIIIPVCILSFISAIVTIGFASHNFSKMKKHIGKIDETSDTYIERCNSGINKYSDTITKNVRYSNYINLFTCIIVCNLFLFNTVEGLTTGKSGDYYIFNFIFLLLISLLLCCTLTQNKQFINDFNLIREISNVNNIVETTIDNLSYKEAQK